MTPPLRYIIILFIVESDYIIIGDGSGKNRHHAPLLPARANQNRLAQDPNPSLKTAASTEGPSSSASSSSSSSSPPQWKKTERVHYRKSSSPQWKAKPNIVHYLKPPSSAPTTTMKKEPQLKKHRLSDEEESFESGNEGEEIFHAGMENRLADETASFFPHMTMNYAPTPSTRSSSSETTKTKKVNQIFTIPTNLLLPIDVESTTESKGKGPKVSKKAANLNEKEGNDETETCKSDQDCAKHEFCNWQTCVKPAEFRNKPPRLCYRVKYLINVLNSVYILTSMYSSIHSYSMYTCTG